jgi:thioester reductase-like protein
VNPTLPAGTGERVLLTGATGFLGQQILRLLLNRYPEAQFVLLLRAAASESADQRLDAMLERCCGKDGCSAARQRIEVFTADTAAERCGLSEHDWTAAAEGVTRVIHSAASVRFDMTLDEARHVNTGGARNLLALGAEAARRGSLRSFAHVSTAFVAGCRSGLVREDELDAGQRFRNSYERSKCEAEALVRARAADLPTLILRPSIVVGDSRTGVTTSFNTIYWPLRAYAQRRWRLAPARPGTVVDMVPVEFVAEAVTHLAWEPGAVGRSFHLCAGPQRSATIAEIADSAARFFRVPPPRFVNPALFLAVIRPLLMVALWGRRRRLLRAGRFYRPYLDMQLQFDTSQADSILAPAGIRPPRVMDYIERLFAYCLESDWGRLTPGNPASS